MRRFSQRNSLVTLSDINITPLLDLAFVLLIIFIITAPVLEHGLNVELPSGGEPDEDLRPENIRQVDIKRNGEYFLSGKQVSLNQLEQSLVNVFLDNPQLTIYIRPDQGGRIQYLTDLIDRCQRNGIDRFSIRTEPPDA
jgi:biopolymer transport protein ExbD